MTHGVSWINKVLGMWGNGFPPISKWCSEIPVILLNVSFEICSPASPTFFPHQPPPIDGFDPRTFNSTQSVKCFREFGAVLRAPNAKPRRANRTQIQGAEANTTCLLDLLPTRPTCSLCPGCGNLPPTVTQSPWSRNLSECELCNNEMKIFLLTWQIIILINFFWKHRFHKLPLDLQTWTKQTAPSPNMILEWNWYWLQGIKSGARKVVKIISDSGAGK